MLLYTCATAAVEKPERCHEHVCKLSCGRNKRPLAATKLDLHGTAAWFDELTMRSLPRRPADQGEDQPANGSKQGEKPRMTIASKLLRATAIVAVAAAATGVAAKDVSISVWSGGTSPN